MVSTAAFVSWYFKIKDFHRGQSITLNDLKRLKVGKFLIDYLLFEICLGAHTIQK